MWQIPVGELQSIVSNSITRTEILNKIGFENKGANFKTLIKVLNLYEIKYDHLINGASIVLEKYRNKSRKPLTSMLCLNSKTDRGYLKKRLLREGIIKNECSICGLNKTWNGKDIIMILDHSNGVSNDNRIENLRMVCPNCNSQLDTHCGKNNKRKRYYCDCGSEITKVAKKCLKCSGFEKRKVKNRPQKERLLIDTKRYGYVKTGKIYGVSDNTIRKWLENTK